MKTIFIIAAFSLIISVSAFAQERSVRMEYVLDGKKVIKEYKGAELEKLMRDAEAKAAAAHAQSIKSDAPTERQVIIQQQGKEPVVYKGAELDKLMQQAQQAAKAQAAKPVIQNGPGITVTAVKQPDGSVKLIRSENSSGTQK